MKINESAESKRKFVEDVLSLMNYIEELIKRYPEGVSQKELAELTYVTSGAISKIKERLLQFCDLEVFAFESKFVLKRDITVFELVLNELWNSGQVLKVLELGSSQYGEEILIKEGLYEYIQKKFPMMPLFFSNEELELGLKILIRYIRSFLPSKKEAKKVEEISKYAHNLNMEGNGEQFLYGILLGKALRKTDLDWPIETDDEMEMVIGIRDKIFYLAEDLLFRFTDNLEIIKSLKTKREKESFKKVYRETTVFYLKKIFSAITESLETTAKNRGIVFPINYREIGNTSQE